MTALITVSNSEGVQGRCDAKCYDAHPGTNCKCVCGGRNHAAGVNKAMANVSELAEVMIAEHKAAHAGEGLTYRANLPLPLALGGGSMKGLLNWVVYLLAYIGAAVVVLAFVEWLDRPEG